ncbi:MAG TPA: hypothetical protein DCG48_08380 [Rhodospirillaceae bacterium]|nr:hypothetical protein [Rhodospirillaceae bacterium]|tara:strand:- start:1203 stop:1661 length:459 start_codon:yes stop_codon:yes gene_type:complete
MNPEFQSYVEQVPGLYAELMRSAAFMEKGVRDQEKKSGIYVFFEEGKAVHVGRTRNLRQRLRSHHTFSHNAASFAFKRARRELGVVTTYKPEGSRADLMRRDDFATEFRRQIDRVRQMEARFLEIKDPILQYLVELYAHLELRLPLDEFDTH